MMGSEQTAHQDQNSWSVILKRFRGDIEKNILPKICEAFRIEPEEAKSLTRHTPIIFLDHLNQKVGLQLKSFFESVGVEIILTNDENLKSRSFRLDWDDMPDLSFLEPPVTVSLERKQVPAEKKSALPLDRPRFEKPLSTFSDDGDLTDARLLKEKVIALQMEKDLLEQKLNRATQKLGETQVSCQEANEQLASLEDLYKKELEWRRENKEYRTKLEEANALLEEKIRDLERDLKIQKVHEATLEESVKTLKAERSEKEKFLETQISQIETEKSLRETQLEEQIKLLTERKTELEAELDEKTTLKESLENEIRSQKEEKRCFEEQLNDFKIDSALREGQLDEKIKFLQDEKSELEQLFEAKSKQFDEKAESYAAEVERWRAELDRSEKEKEAISLQHKEATEQLKVRTEELQELETQIVHLDQEKHELEEFLEQQKREIENYGETVGKIKAESSDLERQLQKDQLLRAELENDMRLVEEQRLDLEARNSALLEELNVEKQKFQETSKTISDLQGKETDLRNELKVRIHDLNELVRLHHQSEAVMEGLQANLIATVAEKEDTVRALKETEEKLRAIEAAQDFMRNEVEEKSKEAEQCRLEVQASEEKKAEADRRVLEILEQLDEQQTVAEDVKARLSSIEQFYQEEQTLRKQLEAQLSHFESEKMELERKLFGVTEESQRLSSEREAFEQKLIMLEGDQTKISSQLQERLGLLETALSEKEALLLESKRDYEDLRLESERRREEFEVLRDDKARLLNAIQNKEKEISVLQKRNHELNERLRSVETEYDAQTKSLTADLHQRLSSKEEELNQDRAHLAHLNRSKSESDERIESLSKKASDYERELVELRNEWQQIKSDKIALDKDLDDKSKEIAVLQRRNHQLSEKLRGQEFEQEERLRALIMDFERKLTDKNEELEKIKSQKTGFSEKNLGSKQEPQGLKNQLQLLESAYREVEEWKSKAVESSARVETLEKTVKQLLGQYEETLKDEPKTKNLIEDINALKKFYTRLE